MLAPRRFGLPPRLYLLSRRVSDRVVLLAGLDLRTGWFQTEFHGSSSFNVPAYAKDYEGHYGLFSIVFKVDGESYLASYNAW